MISFGQTRASTEGDKAIELAEADKINREECELWYISYKLMITPFTDEDILLLTPRSEPLVVTNSLRNQINKFLATIYKVRINKDISAEIIPNALKQWGRMRITGGGDLIHARGYHKLRSDGRDASFVKVRISLLLFLLPTNMPDSTSRWLIVLVTAAGPMNS